MALVDIVSLSRSSFAQGTWRPTDRIVVSARKTVQLALGDCIEDDVFTHGRMKAARLPAIESCQTTIFRELRHREEMTVRIGTED